jgi:hypothetical protein
MPEEWQQLVETLDLPIDAVSTLLDNWKSDGGGRRIESIFKTLGPEAAEPTWPVRATQRQLLRKGVYSPIQLLAWECAKESTTSIPQDFPFLFDLSAAMLSALEEFRDLKPESAVPAWPPNGGSSRSANRKLMQSLFQLRELREEGEPLSIEVSLPSHTSTTRRIPIKRFAQVVGRGVGVAEGAGLSGRPLAKAELARLFRSHSGAPSTGLYFLRPEFNHVPKDRVSVVLRRDGLLTIATYRNPLMNFYDGGWHIEDSAAGERAVDLLLSRRFPDRKIPEALPGLLVRLAHHMAAHWHGGILAVVDSNLPESALHPLGRDGPKLVGALKTVAKVAKGHDLNICDVPADGFEAEIVEDWSGTGGLGRVFLTLAIQDGALLLHPDGRLHSSGRFVTESKKNVGTGGAGARAARALAAFGVTLKISVDGSIKVFAETTGGRRKPGRSLVPETGLRIR